MLFMRNFLIIWMLCLGTSIFAASPYDDHLADALENDHNYAYLLELGDDALLARTHLIRNAKKSIDIQTFIWAPDDTGQFVMYELWRAAQRGVKIRLLIDDLSLRAMHQVVVYLVELHPNIALKQYNPIADDIDIGLIQTAGKVTTSFGKFNHRMHNKIVVVDKQFGITGGRNYQNDYFDRGVGRTFLDRDVLIVGPVVEAMAASFEEYWVSDLSVFSKEMNDVKAELEAEYFESRDFSQYTIPDLFNELSSCADSSVCVDERIVARGLKVEEIEFVADHPGKHEDGDDLAETTESLVKLIVNAKKHMLFQTPYLVAGTRGNSFFKDIRVANPELGIIVSTNSLGAADHFYAYAFSYKNKKKYLKKFRWQIHEMKPAPPDFEELVHPIAEVHRSDAHYACIHSKTFLFDGETVWLGSFNMDPRSARLNTEAGVVIKDREFYQLVESKILRVSSNENSWTIGARGKIPVVSFFNSIIEDIFSYIPFLNIWPFTYSTSYVLREGGTEMPYYNKEFRKNYRSVGQFPGTKMTPKAIKTRLTKAFFGPAQPII